MRLVHCTPCHEGQIDITQSQIPFGKFAAKMQEFSRCFKAMPFLKIKVTIKVCWNSSLKFAIEFSSLDVNPRTNQPH